MLRDATSLESSISTFVRVLKEAEKLAFGDDLSKWAGAILWVIANEGPKNLTEIANQLETSKGVLHAHVQSLRAKGYLVEERGSHGSVLLSLAPQLEAEVHGRVSSVLATLERVFSILTEEERELLATIVERLHTETVSVQADTQRDVVKDTEQSQTAHHRLARERRAERKQVHTPNMFAAEQVDIELSFHNGTKLLLRQRADTREGEPS
ncbi:MarR family winged helix-turn-helix transcriptional regulator [Microvirga terrae]|uniref:MarR family winged helix-turn-helix transcriptional regulator n=1 Tax=Microvirga terrae TaxID=2740529 RepID=A0ABY5RNU1_9HYPH|nr:MarR family winged helix-turn-helix transcriptional regulator [Microvirga terrae]UVF18452.1 MarR family winged helix-turn-helix transcriptional regulator [Microvirga terrae]